MEYDEGPLDVPPEAVEFCIRLKTVSHLDPKVQDMAEVALEFVTGDMRLWVSPEGKVVSSAVNWRNPNDMQYPFYNFTLPPGTSSVFLFLPSLTCGKPPNTGFTIQISTSLLRLT